MNFSPILEVLKGIVQFVATSIFIELSNPVKSR